MKKLLYIEASPRKERSYSIAIAKQFIDSFLESQPETKIETLDLWDVDLPRFDGADIDAKYGVLHGLPHSEEEKKAWEKVVAIFNNFKEADKYVFSVPMWNFGIPYKLKHYIDVITQPGLAFKYSVEQGYTGLVTGKPVVVIYSSGGGYQAHTGMESYDFQKPYIKTWLNFIGFTKIESIIMDGTLGMKEEIEKTKKFALNQAMKLARAF